MKSVFTPILSSQFLTALAVNSGPLSDCICCRVPCFINKSVRQCNTSSELMRLVVTIARHSLAYSSIRVRIFTARFAQSFVFLLKLLELSGLGYLELTVLFAPAVVGRSVMPSCRQTAFTLRPLANWTSASLSMPMICSAVHLFLAIPISFSQNQPLRLTQKLAPV